MYEKGTYRHSSYHDDIGERCDCVSLSVLTLPDQRVHTKNCDEVLDTCDRSYISWCYLTTDVVLPSLRSRALSGMGTSLCTMPNQQYDGIAANVYLRAGRALTRVMIMMADIRVNQTRVWEQRQQLTGIKHTETNPDTVKKIGPRKGNIAGWYTVYCGYCWEDIRYTAVIANNRLTERGEWKVQNWSRRSQYADLILIKMTRQMYIGLLRTAERTLRKIKTALDLSQSAHARSNIIAVIRIRKYINKRESHLNRQ